MFATASSTTQASATSSNASYGFTYSRLYAQTGLHGLAIVQCNAFTGDHVYADFSASGWTQTTSTTLVNQSDIGTGGFLPSAAWTTYRYGVYVGGCLNVTMTATTSEHWDCGFAGDHSQFSLLTGYFEANTSATLRLSLAQVSSVFLPTR
jgi:hypothetical protein